MFLETICILHGEIQNRKAHEERMHRTAAYFGFNAPPLPDLQEFLPDGLLGTKVKCRLTYYRTIEDISFERYTPKKIASLKLVEASIDYSFKFADREALNALLAQKGDCDEILITRNGLITDTSYSNVVFSKGERYFTPENPLLNGTKRQKLLHEGVITEKRIDRDSLLEYDRIYLINALLDIEDGISLPVNSVVV
ncbi:aminotransferase class IV [uncultured Proteiniphilum sp.]|uniref:aminotransferase class IV n=1 Tax=uncultured Proteiniphilum sp. TaxID=497637 RepID=UPI00260AA7ED|nr:aminotransferase class IV [uncultured Proteiniphilum sp.]